MNTLKTFRQLMLFLFLGLNIQVSGQVNLLCQGKYWTEAHANLMGNEAVMKYLDLK